MIDEKQLEQTAEQKPLVYEKPVLVAYGDVRDVTLGPTPGTLESGAEGSLCERGVGTCI